MSQKNMEKFNANVIMSGLGVQKSIFSNKSGQSKALSQAKSTKSKPVSVFS